MPTTSEPIAATTLAEIEATIVSRLQKGDFSIIEELYQAYSPQAFGLAQKMLQNKETAEDVVQEAFLRLWKNPTSYNANRGHFATWLLTIVHNLCVDNLRRSRSAGQYQHLYFLPNEETVAKLVDEKVNIEEEVWLKMERVAINQALGMLPDNQRYLIELAFFKGLTHSEIVLATGLTLGTIKGRIRQGLLKLRELVAMTKNEPVCAIAVI